MKIIYTVNARIPGRKAHTIQVMCMCDAFVKAGHTVELVVPQRKNPIKTKPHKYYGTQGFDIRYTWTLDTVGKWGGIGLLLQEISFAWAALWYTKRHNADCYYTRDMWWAYLASYTGIPYTIEIHDAPKKRRFAYRRVFRHAQHIVTTTKLKRAYMVREYGLAEDSILVAPNGVDVGAFRALPPRDVLRKELGLPADACIIGHVGKCTTFGQGKGVDELVEAFGGVHARDQRTHLLLVGVEDKEHDRLAAQLEADNASTRAKIVGHVPHAQAMRYMKACDILVMNYPDTEHYRYYMFPLKLCEYMASGAAIISTDLPSVREVLSERNALLVPPQDQAALEDTLLDTVANTTLCASLAGQASRDVRKFDWNSRAALIIRAVSK